MYQDSLARRSFLGLQIGEGGAITAVLPGGAGAKAGIFTGDRLLAIDERPFTDARAFMREARAKGTDRRFSFEVRRGDRTLTLIGDAPPLPVEVIEGADVLLGQVASRLRAIFAIPNEHPVVGGILYLQSIRAESCEAPLSPDAPIRKWVKGCAARGWIVLRVERSGVGDSEGPDPTETGLEAELDGYRAGLRALTDLEECRNLPIAIFGHSLGGIIAPLVGTADAIAAFGASARPWTEHARDTSRRQRTLKGFRGEQLATEMSHWQEMLALVCKERWTPAKAFTERPYLKAIRSRECDGETLYGRHVSLFQSLETIDLQAAWASLSGRTLAMHGEHDWISSREDSESIARACAERGTFLELPGIGHDMMRYPSLESSWTDPTSASWDDQAPRCLIEWLDR